MRWSMAWPAPAAHPAEVRGLRASYSAMVYGRRPMVYGLACGVRGLRSMLWPMAWPAARCQAEDRGLWLWVWAQSMVYSDARVYEKQSVGRGGVGGGKVGRLGDAKGGFPTSKRISFGKFRALFVRRLCAKLKESATWRATAALVPDRCYRCVRFCGT